VRPHLFKRALRKGLRLAVPGLLARFDDWSLERGLKRNPSDLQWEMLRRCPAQRLDAGGAKTGKELFVFGGYESINHVLSVVDVLDLETGAWRARFPMPDAMAQSHLAIATDGARFVFVVSGQLGAQCRPATRNCFVLDAQTRAWADFPPLPAARYAATAQLWNGRLHVVGGSREDRHTPAADHWSIAVENGRATEIAWREEPPIPRGGPHRASAILDGKLFVFGGQEGDYIAIPGNPEFVCTGDAIDEIHYPDVYALETGAREWTRKADMPSAVSHTEFSIVQQGNRIALLGGQHVKNIPARAFELAATIQCYDADRDTWKLIGTLPYRTKTNLAALHNGWLYSVAGMRDRSPTDPLTGDTVAHTWRARVSENLI
jgi:hypothetical protein